MDTLLVAMEAVVDDLYGHVHRVSEVATELGRIMGLDAEELELLGAVGVFHDVGKIHVDPRILAKPGLLRGSDLAHMRRHPEIGFAMTVQHVDRRVAEAILHHHERWDGLGYPDGLRGAGIPLLARIVLVADAYDAITNHRSYQPAMPADYAYSEIVSNAGTQFDPEVVEAFVILADRNLLPQPVLLSQGAAAS